MDAPRELRTAARKRDDVTIAHREYDDETIVVIDFGRGVEATLDVVGDLAIVVAGDEQYEFEIPPEATGVTVTDGMLRIESE